MIASDAVEKISLKKKATIENRIAQSGKYELNIVISLI